jgi:hypothetical protein
VIRSLARLTAAVLIIVSAAAFAIGVTLERHSEAGEHPAERPVATSSSASPSPDSPARDTDQDHQRATASPRPHRSGQDADHGSDSGGDERSGGTATASPTSAPTTPAASGTATGQGGDADGGHDQGATHTEAPRAGGSPGSDHDSGAGHESGRAPAAAEAQEHAERLFGINLESTSLVAAAVVVSVLFAAAVLTLGMPWLAGVIAAAMLAFAALDIREIVLQAGRSRPGLAAAATAVALLHLLAALAAAHVARSGPAHRSRATANHT